MDKLTTLLDQLSRKLGTTTQYLWGILLKQAPIAASIQLFHLCLAIGLSIILFRIHTRFSKEDNHGNSRYYNSDSLGVMIGIAAVLIGIYDIANVCNIDTIYVGFFNPEFWAFDHILNAIKSQD